MWVCWCKKILEARNTISTSYTHQQDNNEKPDLSNINCKTQIQLVTNLVRILVGGDTANEQGKTVKGWLSMRMKLILWTERHQQWFWTTMLMCEIGILDFSLRRISMERFTLIISNKCRQITESTGRDQDQKIFRMQS